MLAVLHQLAFGKIRSWTNRIVCHGHGPRCNRYNFVNLPCAGVLGVRRYLNYREWEETIDMCIKDESTHTRQRRGEARQGKVGRGNTLAFQPRIHFPLAALPIALPHVGQTIRKTWHSISWPVFESWTVVFAQSRGMAAHGCISNRYFRARRKYSTAAVVVLCLSPLVR